MTIKHILKRLIQLLVLSVLFSIFFIIGSMAVSGVIPEGYSDPGLLSSEMGLLLLSLVNSAIVMALILNSRWSGWKLMLALSISYYGVVTFITQVETWFFLTDLTVDAELLPRLFIMGIPIAFIFVPLAVWILGKGRSITSSQVDINQIPAAQWVWKLGLIAMVYVLLYWLAGYYIAWQNPELRAFYGSPGEITPFWQHTFQELQDKPGLFLLQIGRSWLWVLFALPVIFASKWNARWTAVLVGLYFSLPQNIGQILENPLMPDASVRFSHMIETVLSTFIFGLIVVWLLNRKHTSFRDLFAIEKQS